MAMLKVEELLAGEDLHHEVEVPPKLLRGGDDNREMRVRLRPLTVRDLQKIRKAAGDDENLSATLMIRSALVEPELNPNQAAQLPAGLAQFLVDRINEISGIDLPEDALREQVQQPLAKACFVLAREFGWTPEQVSGMTLGQILLYIQMSRGEGGTA